MSDSYSFEFSKETGCINLKLRSFEGIGRAEHTVVYSTVHTPEAEGILESLQEALKIKKEFDKTKTENDVKRLEGTVKQAQIDLELKRKELARLTSTG